MTGMEVDLSIDDDTDGEDAKKDQGHSRVQEPEEDLIEEVPEDQKLEPSGNDESRKECNFMNVIRPIDKNVVHRICSGQVVVTLATAVKELVENSVDAGATSIDIRLVEYGSKSIEVTDNGCGVEEANFEGLGLKHYTSKIRDFEDLTSVETFGFRGEALSSLCALSNLTVITKSARSVDGKGYRIEYDNKGRIAKKTQCARDVGTTVIIKNLFSTLPVRHVEFLKNLKREFTRMAGVLYGYCLITSGVRINCTNQLEKGTVSKVVSVPGTIGVREKIVCLFGSKQLDSLVEIKSEEKMTIDETILAEFGLKDGGGENPFRFQGFLSLPYKGRGASDRQFFFFNSRPCDPVKLSRTVNEVYHGYSKNQYPFVFLDIRTAQENLDVNVTPDKRQIFLRNEKILYAAVKSTVATVLTRAATSFTTTESSGSLPFAAGLNEDSSVVERENPSEVEEENLDQSGSSQHQGSSRFARSPVMRSRSATTAAGSVAGDRQNLRSVFRDFSYKPKPAFGTSDSPVVSQWAGGGGSDRSSPKKRISLNSGRTSILSFFQRKEKRRKVESSDDEDVVCMDDQESSQPDSSDLEVETLTSEVHCEPAKESQGSVSKYYSPIKSKARCAQVVHDGSPSGATEEDDDVIIVYDDEFAEEAMFREVTLSGDVVEECPVKLYGNASVVDCTVDWTEVRRRAASSNSKVWEPRNEGRRFRAGISAEENKLAEEELRKQITKNMFPEMEIIGQFNLGFIIAKHGPDLFIVDQHATDEKYNFEDLEKNTALQTQKLICPVELQLPTVSQSVVLDNIEVFRKNGFEFSIKDEDSVSRIQLTQIPYSKSCEFGKQDIDELIFMLEDAPEKAFYRPSRVRDMLASRACRKSVMIGTALNMNEMRRIVDHMALMDQPWNCPHGRPTIRHLLNLNMIPIEDLFSFPY